MKVFIKTKAIKKILIKRNMSQNDLACEIGVSSGYMSQLMDGSRNPSPKLRQRLMVIFPECQFGKLFHIKENA